MAGLLIKISRKQAFLYAFFLVLYEFLTYVANDMIMPGMINVIASFNGPESAIATSLTAYVIGGASLQLILGPVSDHYGRRPVMIFGSLFFLICTILIACTTSIDQFLAARFFQGMGLCFISVIGYATLQEIFAEMDAIRLIAIMANISITAPLLGPLLGALVIYYYSWRLIFVVIASLALVAAWGLWKYMPEPVSHAREKTLEPMLFSLSSVWSNYKRLLIDRRVMMGSITLGVALLPCMAWIALSPIILITEAKLSVFQYSLWQIPVFGASILGNIGLHRMSHYRSLNELIFIGSLIIVLSLLAVFALPLYFGNDFIWLMPGLILYFLGIGVVSAPLNRLILFSTPITKGTVSALMSMISMTVQAIGIEVANYSYLSHINSHLGFYCLGVAIFYCCTLLAALGFRLPNR